MLVIAKTNNMTMQSSRDGRRSLLLQSPSTDCLHIETMGKLYIELFNPGVIFQRLHHIVVR